MNVNGNEKNIIKTKILFKMTGQIFLHKLIINKINNTFIFNI